MKSAPNAKEAAPPGTTWNGRPITDLSREEIETALKWCMTELATFYDPKAIAERQAGRVALQAQRRMRG